MMGVSLPDTNQFSLGENSLATDSNTPLTGHFPLRELSEVDHRQFLTSHGSFRSNVYVIVDNYRVNYHADSVIVSFETLPTESAH